MPDVQRRSTSQALSAVALDLGLRRSHRRAIAPKIIISQPLCTAEGVSEVLTSRLCLFPCGSCVRFLLLLQPNSAYLFPLTVVVRNAAQIS